MRHHPHNNRVTTPRKGKTPNSISPRPKRTTWTIDPDETAERLVARAMEARPGVSRTFIILELVKNGLKQFAGKKDEV